EDGIRDGHVTGVQTCALPICAARASVPGNAEQDQATISIDPVGRDRVAVRVGSEGDPAVPRDDHPAGRALVVRYRGRDHPEDIIDRKSTRLNSSHVAISYAVF